MAGAVTVAIVAGMLLTDRPTEIARPDATATPPPAPSATAGPSTGPTAAPDAAWGDLSLPAWEPIAELDPVSVNASGVSLRSAFIVRSRSSTPAAELAAGMTAEPFIAFTIRPGASPAEARLVPTEPLEDGVLYRFRLVDAAGALAGSWAYRTERPLHVVGTLPYDQSTGVPLNTGIEVEFDQDGITGIAERFSIEPAVDGRFEVHDRTAVFVPTTPLGAETIYTVTIAAGVSQTGSAQVLEEPVAFSFETIGAVSDQAWDVWIGRPMLEASPSEPPVMALGLSNDDQLGPAPTTLSIEVYRLPTFAAARDALNVIAGGPAWGQWSSAGLVPTAGLARVAVFQGALQDETPYGYVVIRFPAELRAGWYIIVVPRQGRDRQALLQVTDLAAYALTSSTRTLAWLNDRATGTPVGGAVLRDPAGTRIGTTDSAGLLNVPTPASLLSAPAGRDPGVMSLATISAPDGRRMLVPLGINGNTLAYDYERNGRGSSDAAGDRWWLLLSTDRSTYRSTDSIHAWGFIRPRDDDTIPTGLELALRAPESSPDDGPWLARVPITATARGAWVGDLPIEALPLGGYMLDLRAGGTVARSSWISVDEIRKPAYRIEVETDRRAVIAGDSVQISARAVFFDGTAAAGMNLRIDAFSDSNVMAADAEGRVSMTVTARMESTSGFEFGYVGVSPASPEEGEIVGYAEVLVFPSSVWLAALGTVRDGRAAIDGLLNRVDLERAERERALGGWPEDPAGAPVAGGTVTVGVVELIPVARQVGTTYDYIEKVAIPLYEYSETRRSVGTYATKTAADGKIALSVPVPNAGHTYEVSLTARDGSGRTTTRVIHVSAPSAVAERSGIRRPYIGEPYVCGTYSEAHAVGDEISLTLHEADGAVSIGGEYLFVVAERGIAEARLQAGSAFTRIYGEADLPSQAVLAVRFRDGRYVVSNQVQIQTRPDERTLTVGLEADKARYQPGQRVTVTVRTSDTAGRPVPADVVVRGVDEKLFAIGQAYDEATLASLLAPTGDGLLQSYVSQPYPLPPRDEGCGDTTGGGDRGDFRDTAVFQLVSTDQAGVASVTFTLPDDLTSWHLSATAISADLRAGDGSLLVPVGLPFFADAILASDYLVGDQPVLRVRSFGDALTGTDRVQFTISAPSLLLPPTTIQAAGLAVATLDLPALPLGVHAITIKATLLGDAPRTDTLIRKLVVRTSRLEVATSEIATPATAPNVGGPGLTTYVVTDAGRGSLLPTLENLAQGGGARFDRLLAADMARDLLVTAYGFDVDALQPSTFEISRYQRGGVALLPYSSPDLTLTALTAIVVPERLHLAETMAAFRGWMVDEFATRERRIIALAGLAGLGEDVLDDLRAEDPGAVTTREALWLALGMLAAGDENGARSIERMLLERDGQELGPWVRLDAGASLTSTLDASALLALIATGVGDPLAPRIDRYVREMRTSEALYVLQEIGVVTWSLDRLPRAAARFAWTVDGSRHEEDLAPGASWTVALTAAQRAGFSLEQLAGAISVVASWSTAPGPGDLPSGGLVTISRTVTPAADAPTTGLVRVTLGIIFDTKAPQGCWEVTDRAPSGLAPLAAERFWDGDQSSASWRSAPTDVSGQRVTWCVDPVRGRYVTLRYAARVVSAGTFTWEPAVIQSGEAPEVGATTPEVYYTIR
ncbi:MAG: hypothetical protein HW391_254 [Chloroflexi bacterium]|nr:hypothetical protein [Chloroflexota bacterium]